MRLVIELRSDQLDPSLKHLCIVKGNYLPPEFKQQSYVLHFDQQMNLTSTGGSLLVESGVGVEHIRDLLGHTDTATTLIYIEMAVRRRTLENSPASIIEAMLLGKEK